MFLETLLLPILIMRTCLVKLYLILYFKLVLEELIDHAMVMANVMEMEQGLETGSAVVIRDMKGSFVWTAVMDILVHCGMIHSPCAKVHKINNLITLIYSGYEKYTYIY